MSLEHSPAREHNEQQQFLTERETAELLRVSARTLQRWRLIRASETRHGG